MKIFLRAIMMTSLTLNCFAEDVEHKISAAPVSDSDKSIELDKLSYRQAGLDFRSIPPTSHETISALEGVVSLATFIIADSFIDKKRTFYEERGSPADLISEKTRKN